MRLTLLLLTLAPLVAQDDSYILQPEFKPDGAPRRQGGVGGYRPELWPVTSCAGYWGKGDGDRSWLNAHLKALALVKKSQGPVDILLVGDSIMQQWGGGYDGKPFNDVWQKYFADKRTVNIGIAGDKTQNLLWRLEHGAVDGLEPKVAVVLIGVNNLYFAGEVSRAAMAQGIKAVVGKLRERFPPMDVVVVSVLPAGEKADVPFRSGTVELAAATKALQLERDLKVHLIDFGAKLLDADGTLSKAISPDSIHLSAAGYEIFAQQLRSELKQLSIQ